ncbi:hypothetical protein [Candidatus Amarolinea aalborgensis]|uniref:hypothetical protein n=1 Tax=Candidatus Amarolinea aalborgensis TaxID=2249329 RepID=UPI003BFA26A4
MREHGFKIQVTSNGCKVPQYRGTLFERLALHCANMEPSLDVTIRIRNESRAKWSRLWLCWDDRDPQSEVRKLGVRHDALGPTQYANWSSTRPSVLAEATSMRLPTLTAPMSRVGQSQGRVCSFFGKIVVQRSYREPRTL